MNPLEPTCDEYLEVGMRAAEPSRFGIRLGPDSPAAGAVDIYSDVESSLRRSFVVPDLSNLIGRVEAAAAQIRRGGRDAIEGTIRWFAAAAALLFMFMTVCVSTLLAPVSERVEGESARGWSNSLVGAVGVGLSTASALLASGVRLRRDRNGRLRVRRSGTSEALSVEWAGPSVTPLVVPATGYLDREPRPGRPNLAESIDARGYCRRELDPVGIDEAADGRHLTVIHDLSELALRRRDGCGTVRIAA